MCDVPVLCVDWAPEMLIKVDGHRVPYVARVAAVLLR